MSTSGHDSSTSENPKRHPESPPPFRKMNGPPLARETVQLSPRPVRPGRSTGNTATIKHPRPNATVRGPRRSTNPIIPGRGGEGEPEPTMGPPRPARNRSIGAGIGLGLMSACAGLGGALTTNTPLWVLAAALTILLVALAVVVAVLFTERNEPSERLERLITLLRAPRASLIAPPDIAPPAVRAPLQSDAITHKSESTNAKRARPRRTAAAPARAARQARDGRRASPGSPAIAG